MKSIVCCILLLLQTLNNVNSNNKDLTLLVKKTRSGYEATCVVTGNSTNLAVDWITSISTRTVSIESKFIPSRGSTYDCEISSKTECSQYWSNSNNWNLENSLRTKLEPVLDRRWEKLLNLYTDAQSFRTITTLPEDYQIHISLRGTEGHLYLCDVYNPPVSQCYYIIINGWAGRTTGIRKCKNKDIPYTLGNSPSGSCFDLRQNNSNFPNIIDPSKWAHFTLRRNTNKIQLFKVGDDNPILNYVDNDTPYSASVLIAKSRGPAYWRLHNYDYISTNKQVRTFLGPQIRLNTNSFCGSVLVSMCEDCKLIFEVLHQQEDVQITENTIEVSSSNRNQWKEVKIYLSGINAESIYFRVTTVCINCDNPFWAIDDFQLCKDREIRVLKSTLKLEEIVCQIVATSDKITYKGSTSLKPPEVLCPIGAFGNTCENCSTVLNNNCNTYVVCNVDSTGENVCRCSPGFVGSDCNEKCPTGYYGHGCKEPCGYCEFSPCNTVTGNCNPSQCLSGYRGSNCKIPPLPILKVPPTVLIINHRSCVVQVQNSSYIGDLEPSYYKIQYKVQADTNWTSLPPVDLNNQEPILITNLNVSTTYNIRAVLIMDDNKSYEMESVPKTSILTTCAFVEQNDVNIQATNITATITLKSNSESCSSSDYRVWINNVLLQRSESYNFEIKNLTPFTSYKVSITNVISNGSIVLNLQTQEGVSSQVLNIKTLVDSTSITLSWDSPQTPNGVVRYYQVSYQHVYNLACEKPVIHNTDLDKHVVVDSSTTITVQNLIPYSEYSVKIVPVTVVEGETSIILVQTGSTGKPDENELPTMQNIGSGSTFVSILLSAPDCTIVKGSSVLYISYQCSNEWCSQTPDFINYTKPDYKRIISIKSLFPYTSYDINIKITRNLQTFDGPNYRTKITTLSSVPNMIANIVVYSKNETSVSVRFPEPYPPTGKLVEYQIIYCIPQSFVYSDTCYKISTPPKECLLWPNLQCVTVPNLNGYTSYYFKISAKNHNTEFGGSTRFDAFTQVERPSAPQNITAEWDDYHNLTVGWIHPSITNGVLTNFSLQVLKGTQLCMENVFPMSEDKYQYIYSFPTQIDKKCYSSKLDIFVWASTMYAGDAGSLHSIFSPPLTPSLVNEPEILTITNTSISISFKLQEVTDFTRNTLIYIIMSTSSDTNVQSDYVEAIWRKSGLTKKSSSWIAAEYNYNFINETSNTVILGSGIKFQSFKLQREIYNRELSPATDYIITFLLINTYMDMERFAVYRVTATTTGLISDSFTETANNALFALLLLLLLPFILWFIIWKVKKHKDISWNTLVTMVNAENTNVSDPDVIPLATNERKKSSITVSPKIINNSKVTPRPSIAEKYSKPIKIIEFENYVKESILNGELERQHQLFPRGQTKPWDYGILPQNKSKNRYKNLIAYDHTRVKLEKTNNDEFSDYINANYVEGYNSSKAYIATQGPKPSTLEDFWKMIWQENVHYIVMLANVIEGGKKKSEQYWPNIKERIAYGNIEVLFTATQVFADYEYRTFSVQCENETRKIEHLHFTSWPDHGVPLYCQSLVPFLRKLLTIPQGSSPVVVHCSAGVGRTGTIILSDLCLRMAAREGVVDVLKHQHQIREQRVNLVDNLEQYKLVHLVLLECLIAPQTSFTCDETIEKSITKILETDTLKHHVEYLNNTDWQDYAMQPLISLELKPQWALKNRFQDIVPSGVGRIYLSRYPVSDEHSDYINAVEVDGFRAPQRFIATQQPLPHTVCDFWRMIDEKEISTIISLNQINKEDKTSCVFWPTKKLGEIKPVSFITLLFQNKTKKEFYNMITITLQNTKTKKVTKRTVNIISLTSWKSGQVVPENIDILITLWEEMENLARGNQNPIVVTCHDGVTSCGLYLALTFVIEKIQLEQQCDVCLAVRTIRHNQKKFVTKKEQFIFLYKATLIYLSGFELYSNFNSIIKN